MSEEIRSATGEAASDREEAGDARATTAVLLLGFGGPDSPESVAPFMRNLMGVEPSQEMVETVQRKYLTIGGESPMMQTAVSLAQGIESELAKDGTDIPVALGMRYAPPFISQTLRGMYEWGIRRVVTVSLSPFESLVTTGAYGDVIEAVQAELPGLEIIEGPALRDIEAFRGLLVMGVVEALTELKDLGPILTVFTAHSLPLDEIAKDDSYVRQLYSVIDGIVDTLGMPIGEQLDGTNPALPGIRAYGNLREPQPWMLAYQSAGERGGEWIGPHLDEVIDAVKGSDYRSVALCPIGFAVDHMETLYDLDVVAADRLLKAEVEYFRAPVPNDDVLLVEGIANAVKPFL